MSKYVLASTSRSSERQKSEDLLNPAPICLLSGEIWAPMGEGNLLDSVLDCVLSQMQPVCLAEQGFCVSFLQLDSVLSPSKVGMCINQPCSRLSSIAVFSRV